jgi:hypothetical protein
MVLFGFAMGRLGASGLGLVSNGACLRILRVFCAIRNVAGLRLLFEIAFNYAYAKDNLEHIP